MPNIEFKFLSKTSLTNKWVFEKFLYMIRIVTDLLGEIHDTVYAVISFETWETWLIKPF